jgi:hypothetical protein
MNRSLHQAAFIVTIALACGSTFAQDARTPSLAPNQTLGYGANHLTTFTYTQSFDCVDQPKGDLTFNGIPAALDPAEFQVPFARRAFSPRLIQPA